MKYANVEEDLKKCRSHLSKPTRTETKHSYIELEDGLDVCDLENIMIMSSYT